MKYLLLLALLAGIALAEETAKNDTEKTARTLYHGGNYGGSSYNHQQGYGHGYGDISYSYYCPKAHGDKCENPKGNPKKIDSCKMTYCQFYPSYGYDRYGRPQRIDPYKNHRSFRAVTCAEPNTPCQCNSRTSCACARKAKICKPRTTYQTQLFTITKYRLRGQTGFPRSGADDTTDSTDNSDKAEGEGPRTLIGDYSSTYEQEYFPQMPYPSYPPNNYGGYEMYPNQEHYNPIYDIPPPQYPPHPMPKYEMPYQDPIYGMPPQQYPPHPMPKYEMPYQDPKYGMPQNHGSFPMPPYHDPKSEMYNDPKYMPYQQDPKYDMPYGYQTPNPYYGGNWYQQYPQYEPYDVQESLTIMIPVGCSCH